MVFHTLIHFLGKQLQSIEKTLSEGFQLVMFRNIPAFFYYKVDVSSNLSRALGDRAFLAAAPKLWNGLPSQIRNEPNLIGLKVYLRPIFFD